MSASLAFFSHASESSTAAEVAESRDLCTLCMSAPGADCHGLRSFRMKPKRSHDIVRDGLESRPGEASPFSGAFGLAWLCFFAITTYEPTRP